MRVQFVIFLLFAIVSNLGLYMWFVALAKMRGALDPEFNKQTEQFMANPPAGIKIHKVFHTLGQYDVLILYEAPDEKASLLVGMMFGGKAQTETLVAVPLEEAKELIKKSMKK